MTADPHVLAVVIRAKPGREEQVREEVTAQLTRIRAEEPACSYIAGNQHADDPARFLIYEIWRDRGAFDRFYAERPSMREYLARMRELVAEGELTHWETVA